MFTSITVILTSVAVPFNYRREKFWDVHHSTYRWIPQRRILGVSGHRGHQWIDSPVAVKQMRIISLHSIYLTDTFQYNYYCVKAAKHFTRPFDG